MQLKLVQMGRSNLTFFVLESKYLLISHFVKHNQGYFLPLLFPLTFCSDKKHPWLCLTNMENREEFCFHHTSKSYLSPSSTQVLANYLSSSFFLSIEFFSLKYFIKTSTLANMNSPPMDHGMCGQAYFVAHGLWHTNQTFWTCCALDQLSIHCRN